MKIDAAWLVSLIGSYREELAALAPRIRDRKWEMLARGERAALSDFEGEVLYALIRETRPGVVFEVSPDCGYSTIYLHEAVRANGAGKVVSFELEPLKEGRTTLEAITRNLLSSPDADSFELVVGDAAQTTVDYPDDPDILFLDSSHEASFARWYWESLVPRVRLATLVQDVAYHDRPEWSGEAAWVMGALKDEQRPALSLGRLERTAEAYAARAGIVPRRPYESNSIILAGRDSRLESGGFDVLDPVVSHEIESLLAFPPTRQNAHRDLLALSGRYATEGNPRVADLYWRRAVAHAIAEAGRHQEKEMAEVILDALARRRPGRVMAALATALVYAPAGIRRAARIILRSRLNGRRTAGT